MTAEEHLLFRELLAERIGLVVDGGGAIDLERVVALRMDTLGIGSFLEYYRLLLYRFEAELLHISPGLCEPDGCFFQDADLMHAWLQRRAGGGPLRVLFCGCGYGEEAYSLKMLAAEWPRLELSIDAFDLDAGRIQAAEEAVYGQRSLRNLDPMQVRRYFERVAPERFLVSPEFRSGDLHFFVGNLVQPDSLDVRAPYDAVFARGVLNCFDGAAREAALDTINTWLRPGGLLMVGSSESMVGASAHFEAIVTGSGIAYQPVDLD